MKRIPFDSMCLAAATSELRDYEGAKVQKVVMPSELEVWIQLYSRGATWLILSADPVFSRSHLSSRRPPAKLDPQPAFMTELRKRVEQGTLVKVRQVGFDRILELSFTHPLGQTKLIAELMGKHANLILVQGSQIIGATTWLGAKQSRRPVLPGQIYNPPPFPPRLSLLSAGPNDAPEDCEGVSPFLAQWLQAKGWAEGIAEIQRRVKSRDFEALEIPGRGAYPLPLDILEIETIKHDSFSQAIDHSLSLIISEARLREEKASLLAVLNRVVLAREVAIQSLEQAANVAARAGELQREAELILAYQGQINPGDKQLSVFDYDGNPLLIKLDPERTPLENSNLRFAKAKHAKSGSSQVQSQLQRMQESLIDLKRCISNINGAVTLQELEPERAYAEKMKWFHRQLPPTTVKEDRPYAGHAIRELLSPGGWRILYGDNATSNDYLTTKIAKPNDYWLHVRGGPSSHVVLCTNNQPGKVQRSDLLFAAEVAVRQSPSKHSQHVSVDYCLKKYVRKPKSSGPGMASYTNEKTLTVARASSP